MKKLIFALVVMLASISVISTANAKTRHKRNHYHVTIYKHKHKKANVVIGFNKPIQIYFSNENENESVSAFFMKEKTKNVVSTLENNKKINLQKYDQFDKSIRQNGSLINLASKYIGATARQLGLPRSLWCADFMNMITHSGTDRTAKSYISRGSPANYGCINCVAITTRRGGGHVGVVSGYDRRGNPILISGNHGRKVGVGTYAKYKVIAYRYIL
jgi:uncharacterized protein (TIGR02594 family)